MGNRAVIINKADMNGNGIDPEQIGIYLHWNGGRDSVEAFLTYCEMRGFRKPDEDPYGWARLTQIIANYMGGELSLGIGQAKDLDTDNCDNGTYLIEGWKIVGRKYQRGAEQRNHDLYEMLCEIDGQQPEKDRLGADKIKEQLKR